MLHADEMVHQSEEVFLLCIFWGQECPAGKMKCCGIRGGTLLSHAVQSVMGTSS